MQVTYKSAFRPSFCLNGSFARVFKIFRHRQTDRHTHTHTGLITLPLRKRGVMRLFLADHACASFVTAPTRITLVLGQTGLSYLACDERRLVSSCECSAPHQQLVRATIGALALGCPPLGNSRTRSYHAMSVDIPYRPAPVIGIILCARILTFAPVNDHVMPGDVTFTVSGVRVRTCGMWRLCHRLSRRQF